MSKKGKIPTNNLLGITASVLLGGDNKASAHGIVTENSLDSIKELDDKTYSTADRTMVLRTAIGCCKFILETYSDTSLIKKRAKKRLTKKGIALRSILRQFDESRKSDTISPSQLISNFPPEIKGIQQSDVSEVLSESVRYHVLSHSKSKRKKRGRSKVGGNIHKSGPKSDYEQSKLLKDAMSVFVKPAPRKAIFWLLMDSGLLRTFIYGFELCRLYQIKYYSEPSNETGELQDKADDSNSSESTDNKHQSIIERLKKMDDSALKDEAAENSRAVYSIITDEHDLMLYLYVKGALEFFEPSLIG